jgi:HSP20 family molecular chaperone IbpA
MFKKNLCPRCNERIKKSFSFCPSCGFDLDNLNFKDGFLGKKDFEELGIKLPFGFNALLKPLIKELNKQISELDREFKDKNSSEDSKVSFSLHFGVPGQKGSFQKFPQKSVVKPKKSVILPKISNLDFQNYKSLPRVEPKTNIRRLSDKVVYELELEGVKSIEKINFNKLENSLEIKAISNDKVFVKEVDISFDLTDYFFDKEKLFLEFALK